MRVLLATDGSDDAKTATRYLAEMPLPEGSRVRIVTVGARRASPADLPGLSAYYDALAADHQRLVEDTGASLGRRGAIETAVLEGGPREEIVREAREWRADLVVLGARGLGAFDALLLGSVSLSVARHAECSVLVVKGQGRRPQRIIVGIDGSEESVTAARFLTELPLDATHHVELVGVVEPIHFPATAPFFVQDEIRGAIQDMKGERRAALAKAMNEVVPRLEARRVGIDRSMPEGHPARMLTTAAAESGAGLIVVGARGLGGVRRFLLGSVSDAVLRAAQCPVLIVKRPSAIAAS